MESRWWHGKNTSIRSIYELIADIHCDNPHKFEYEMINNQTGFAEILKRQLKNRDVNYIVIAAHGDENNLQLYNKETISRVLLRNTLKKDEYFNLAGLHFSSCSFMNENLAKFLYDTHYHISPWWISGYGHEVDWIDSSAFEFIFFNKILMKDINNNHPSEIIGEVCDQLWKECSGLIKKFKFQVFSIDKRNDLWSHFPYK